MSLKLPFQFIEGLEERPRTQLWRNFEDIQRALTNVTPAGAFTGRINASQVDAGTFPTGIYTFSGDVTIGGAFRASHNTGTGLYVRPASAVVDIGRYLDFHTTGIADEATDFSARFNCWSATDLDLQGTNLHVLDGVVQARNAEMGRYTPDWSYASFRNKDDTGGYQIMCRNTGLILINSGGSSDQRVLLGVGGTHYVDVQASRTQITNTFEITGTSWFHFVTYGGGWYMQDTTWIRAVNNKAVYTAGILRGDGGLRTDSDRFIADAGGCYFTKNNSGGQYNTKAFRAAGTTAGNSVFVGYSAWQTSNTAINWYIHSAGGATWEAANSSTSAHCPIKASAFTVMSARDSKKNIRSLAAGQRHTTKLRPVRFRRDPITVDPETGEFRDYPANRKNEMTDYLGFVAEEVAEYAPEAVEWRPSDPDDLNSEPKPSGLDVMAMVALLAQEMKDIDARLERVEGLPAISG